MAEDIWAHVAVQSSMIRAAALGARRSHPARRISRMREFMHARTGRASRPPARQERCRNSSFTDLNAMQAGRKPALDGTKRDRPSRSRKGCARDNGCARDQVDIRPDVFTLPMRRSSGLHRANPQRIVPPADRNARRSQHRQIAMPTNVVSADRNADKLRRRPRTRFLIARPPAREGRRSRRYGKYTRK